MKKIFNQKILGDIFYQCEKASKIALVTHFHPDGDALGSSLALLGLLKGLYRDKEMRLFVPNKYPKMLHWVDRDNEVEIYLDNRAEIDQFLLEADVLFMLDMNHSSRLEDMTAAFDANRTAVKIMIDHHIDPNKFDYMIHTTESSSTALLVYHLIMEWRGKEAITRNMAEALYLGMMTDTGGFSFGNLSSDMFHAVGVLVERGVDAVAVNRAIYNTQSEMRMRMVAYLISNKMVINHEKRAAYITLTTEEKERFDYQIGDTEGVVNIPLSIDGMVFSALLVHTPFGDIKVSLRSVGSVDVNVIARKYFNGGGHMNAAGGRIDVSMDECIAILDHIIATEI